MRIRDRTSGGGLGPTQFCRAETRNPSTNQWDDWTVAHRFSNEVEEQTIEHCEDTVIPDFHRRIAAGEIINNPMFKTTVFVKSPNVVNFDHTVQNTNGNGFRFRGPYVPFSDGVGFPPACLDRNAFPDADEMKSDALNLAVTKAHAHIDESEMLLLTSAYEAEKTVGFMVDTLGALYRLAKNARKGNFSAIAKGASPAQLAEIWMNFRYGARPLYYDVQNAMAALEKKRAEIRKVYRGWSEDSASVSDVIPGCGMHYETDVSISRKATYTVSARAGVLCDVRIDGLSPYGITKIPESIWEIIPFSFVIDWFCNVGDIIAALSPKAGVQQRASWVTVKEEITATNSSGSVTSTAPSEIWDVVNYSQSSMFTYGRREIILERIKDPHVSAWPTVDFRLDAFKLTDLGIMLRQLLF